LADDDRTNAAADGAPLDGRSELTTRVISAVAMLAIAGLAFWLGNPVWALFVIAVAALCLREFLRLVSRGFASPGARLGWSLMGAVYIALAALALFLLPRGVVAGVIAVVIATDVGAYFAGRAIGGPRIAPSISPSKTWAGLAGGALLAGLVAAAIFIANTGDASARPMVAIAFAIGAGCAVVAQAGDFFESWLKRRAGCKDSGDLIPGHGGIFDRVDGLLAVAIVAAPLWGLHP